MSQSLPVEEETIESKSHLGSERSFSLDILICLVDPRSDLGFLRQGIAVNLISSSYDAVNRFLFVLAKNVSPKRIRPVECFSVDTSRESVTADQCGKDLAFESFDDERET